LAVGDGSFAAKCALSAAGIAGAAAAVLGTRFLMTPECGAHERYKERLAAAQETVLTELFGMGWPGAPHRVVQNAATERWLRRDRRGPAAVRLANRIAAPLASLVPMDLANRMAARQAPGIPFYGPAVPTRGSPESLLDAGALYAGETVARISEIRPAAELVAELTRG